MARTHRFPLVSILSVFALLLLAGSAQAGDRVSGCGGSGQDACKVWQAVPSCDEFLTERLEECGFLCVESVCRPISCGGVGDRSCVPFVDHPWPDVCEPGLFTYLGTCRQPDADGYPTFCGGHEEDACDVTLQVALGITSCKPGHVEEVGLPLGTCYRIDDGNEPPASCDPGIPGIRCNLLTMAMALDASLEEDIPEKLKAKLQKKIARAYKKLDQVEALREENPKKAQRKLRGVERQVLKIRAKAEKQLAREEPRIERTLAELLVRECSAAEGEVVIVRADLEPVMTFEVL